MARKGIQLCYPFEESRLAKWDVPFVIVQPKLDGERCLAHYHPDNGWILLSSEGNTILSVPHINHALQDVRFSSEHTFDGELYCHGLDFSDIHSRVGRTANLHENFEDIKLHLFDIKSPNNAQWKRIDTLNQLYDHGKFPSEIVLVRSVIASTTEEILSHSQSFLEEGYEGFIVRNPTSFYVEKRSTNIMKFKPRKEDLYRIVGFTEEISKDGNYKNSLGALICCSPDDFNTVRWGTKPNSAVTFNVGSGFTALQRAEFWDIRQALLGRMVAVKYQQISPKGVPRFPIFKEIL